MESRIATSAPVVHSFLIDLIADRLAIVLSDHAKKDIARAVEELRAAGVITSEQDMCNKLSQQDTTQPLWQEIIWLATIGETYFFRDRSQMNVLWNHILPCLIREREHNGYKTLRIWSAGCSTGEEPYSVAMILRDLIPDINSWDIRILATDLNSIHLERAKRGLYRSWSFRSETPPTCQQQWFVEEDGRYRIDDSIRNMVTFEQLNLADGEYTLYKQPMMQMDVIICRNVLIYFDKQTVSNVIDRFHNTLSETGWLVLGHSESSHMANHAFQTHNFEGAALYQKKPFQPAFTPVAAEVERREPVSKPKLLAPPVAHKKATLEMPIHKHKETSLPTNKVDPWTLAHDAANRENWAEALQWLQQAENENIMRPEVHYLRGIVELHQNEIDKSMASMRRAIYCKNEFVLAHFTLGEIFEKLGHPKKAANHWSQARKFLSQMEPVQVIEYSDKLTVEMLDTVLEYRLSILFAK